MTASVIVTPFFNGSYIEVTASTVVAYSSAHQGSQELLLSALGMSLVGIELPLIELNVTYKNSKLIHIEYHLSRSLNVCEKARLAKATDEDSVHALLQKMFDIESHFIVMS